MVKSLSPSIMRTITVDDAGSPSSLSPLHYFSQISLSPTTALGSPLSSSSSTSSSASPELRSDERGLYTIHLLLNCANHISSGTLDCAHACLDRVSLLVSPEGDAIQRVAAYFTSALARRILRSWPGLYRALDSPTPVAETLLARRHFFDLCPFIKLASLLSNRAILESMEGERVVHVVDLGGIGASPDLPAQWLALLHVLRGKPEGPPHLRITAVDERKDLLDHAGSRLSEAAERLDIPFRFNSIAVAKLEDLDVESLNVKTGEALAISAFVRPQYSCGQLEGRPPKPASSGIGTLGELLKRDHSGSAVGSSRLLKSLRGLSPKVVVVTEQEWNHKGRVGERFAEALNYYAAMFDCLESMGFGAGEERGRVERAMLGEEIKGVIGSEEGWERWGMEKAGFGLRSVSRMGVSEARKMLIGYGVEGYGVREEGGRSLLCWQDRPLYSVSAWGCRRV